MTKKKTDEVVNLSVFAQEAAERNPFKPAVVFPQSRDRKNRVSYTHLTFKQLSEDIDAYACGLKKIGIKPGMRVSFMVTPSLEFLPICFALFRIGAVPVLIDPGMGKLNLLNCIRSAEPEGFIGIPRAQLAKKLFGKYFKSVRINVTIGRKLFWGGCTMDDIYEPGGTVEPASTKPEDTAAIIFTTGSTGPPKGVVYTHGMFCAQRDLLMNAFDLSEDDVDMPAFALFSIFTLAMGCTVVIPDMDQTRPAEVDPIKIIEAVENYGVTFSFGSPALWNTVSRYCVVNGVQFQTLKKVFMAGAPIPPYLHERMLAQVLPEDAEVFTPYGATECLPVTSFEGSNVLKKTQHQTAEGAGFCVGEPLPGLEVKIIRISDEVIEQIDQVDEMPQGEIGETIVKGPVVSREYFNMPEKTAEHKIYESSDKTGLFWHRIGDLGYLDKEGRLWMCGRKTHRVETGESTLFTVCCEAIFNQHPHVYRAALVGVTKGDTVQPVVIIEPEKGSFPMSDEEKDRFRNELRELAERNENTKDLDNFLFKHEFPVDIRHNAKIFREKLAVWAKEHIDK